MAPTIEGASQAHGDAVIDLSDWCADGPRVPR